MLENGTAGAAQESISQSSVSAVEPRIIDSNSRFFVPGQGAAQASVGRAGRRVGGALQGGGARFFGLCSRMAGSGCQRYRFFA